MEANQEKLENDKQIILGLFENGLPMRRMVANFGYKRNYIVKIRDMLIAENKITKEKIELALEKYLRENPPAQGLGKTKVAVKSKGREKADRRHNNSLAKKARVFELVGAKYSKTKIAREMGITFTSVNTYIKELIEEGKVSEDDIVKESPNESETSIDRTNPDYIEKRDEVVELLKLGWKNNNIRKTLDITPYDFDIYIRDIRKRKIMTTEEINEARERKKQEDLDFIEACINNDEMCIAEIREQRPDFAYNELPALIKELIKLDRVTQEQVDVNAKNAKRRTENSHFVLSYDEQIAFILAKMKEGYSPAEIVEADETKSINIHKAQYQKIQLIAQGKISKAEADAAMNARQAKFLEEKHKKAINKIIELTKQGYYLYEMPELMGEDRYSKDQIWTLKKEYTIQNGWFSKEELKMFVEARKKREFENLSEEERNRIIEERLAVIRRKEEEKRQRQLITLRKIQAREDMFTELHRKHIIELKQHIKNGKTMTEAATQMGYSISYLYKIRKESIQNNTWFSEDEIRELYAKKSATKEDIRDERKRQKEIERAKREEENALRVKKLVWSFRNYIEQGYKYKEIADFMNYSIPILLNLRRLAIADNIWFSQEAIKSFRELREKRELVEAQKKEREEKIREAQKRRQLEKLYKEEQALEKAFEKQRKKKIRSYDENYKMYRKMAKKEDKLELDGEENVTTDGREKFFEILLDLHNLDVELKEYDIEIIMNYFAIHPKLANRDVVKMVIEDANKKAGLEGVETTLKELIYSFKDTNFYSPLLEYRLWVGKQLKLPKIKELKALNMTNAEIAARLGGISSAEVGIIYSGQHKPTIFDVKNRE